MSETVLVQRAGEAVKLVLNRPEARNALSHEMLVALDAALRSPICSNSTEITLTGAGSSFSAGADFTELTGTIEDLRVDDDIARVNEAIASLAGTVTALVNGPCMGGAVDIALACDDRVATPEAVFQVPATRLSLLYNPSSVQRMVNRYGKELLVRIMVRGEPFDAAAAFENGIVSRVAGECSPVRSAEPETADPNGPVASATLQMIESIDNDSFDLQYWEQVRREFLKSEERHRAVKEFKARMAERNP